MPTHHRVRIVATADVPYGAASELAAVRLVALLPARWTCAGLECTPTSAVLALALPGEASPAEVALAVDAALAQSTLRGWARVPA
ncbi:MULTISPECIES: hypothetical protein [unclassified Kitasatospora]|uniref:hypothetical protein n=1 Tax=unclassified Kitasatospora TaxID=2633591 RepID=UPI001ADFC78B|nr:hypothetical protein [Kitasatospora sp. RG8]MBP0452186.1 hypothetical protein [Kitasatospora sp. RG8]